MKNGRTLPHSIEAEQGLLGCVLISEEAQGDILDKCKPIDFYSNAHKTIFSIMQELYNKGTNVDFITVVQKLEAIEKLSDCGGLNYITTLSNIVPSSANYQNYIDIVKTNSKQRKLIKASEKIIEASYETDGKENVDALMQNVERDIFNISDEEQTSGLMEVDFDEVLNDYSLAEEDPNYKRGVKTNFYALDKVIGGLNKGDIAILAARPAMGKTAFAFNIGVNVAEQEKSVAVFSLEMPKRQLAERMICGMANIDMSLYKRNKLDLNQVRAMKKANEKLKELRLTVDDSSMNTPASILSKCRKLKRERGLDLVIVDYLQLMSGGNSKENRQNQVSEMSRMLKVAARELNVPILVLSQLSRACELRQNKKPLLSDLRESGAIEQDADIVMFLYRDDYYKSAEPGYKPTNLAEVIIAKNRNGALETAVMGFKGESTQFYNLSKDANLLSLEESLKIPF